MQDWSDRRLDDRIADALQSETMVTSQQRMRAWETLRAKAAVQPMLSADEPIMFMDAARPSRMNEMRLMLVRGLRALLVEEPHFERALRDRASFVCPYQAGMLTLRYSYMTVA
jgi:hypothetical protein